MVRRAVGLVVLAAGFVGFAETPAQAQGNGPGFHASVHCDGGCSAAFSQTVSDPSAPAAVGPVTAPCISGSATAAGEADTWRLRALAYTEHQCCGTGSFAHGRGRIQIANVV